MGTNQSFLLKIDPPDLEFCETKQEDKWRLNFVKESVNVKNNILTLDQNEDSLTTEELEDIFHYICTS